MVDMPDDAKQHSVPVILLVSAGSRRDALPAPGDGNDPLVWLSTPPGNEALAQIDCMSLHAVLLDETCPEAGRPALRRAARARQPAPLLVELRADGAHPPEADLALHAAIPDADLRAILHALLRQRARGATPPNDQILRGFVEAAPTIVIMMDRALRFVAVSAGYQREFGQGSREVMGRHAYELFPDLPEHWRRMHRDSLGGATRHIDEEHYPHRDGSIDWVRATTQPWREADGTIGGVLVFADFITRRKRAEDALRRNEQRYRLALKGAPITVFEQDAELRFTWFDNSQVASNAEHALGRTDIEVFENPADAEVTMALKRQVLESGVGTRQEVRVHYQGKERFWDLTIEPLRDASDRISGITCAAWEVTDRKRAASELAASQALLRAVVEQIPAAIAIIEPPDGNCVMRSHHATKVFGAAFVAATADGVRHWSFAEHLDGRPLAREEHPGWRALYRGDTVIARPLLFRRLDGRLIDIEVSAGPVRNAEGDIIAAVIATFDVSERRGTERALVRAYADLEQRVAERTRALSEAARELAAEMHRREQAQALLLQAQKLDALGQMTGGIAHDFRNVLTAVSTNLELIRERTDEPRLLRSVDRAESAVLRANRLVGQLLAFARRQDTRPKLVDLVALTPSFLDFASHSLPGGTRCTMQVDPDIAPILVDPAQLEVALLNLLMNARDAMQAGGTITIVACNLPRDPHARSRLAAAGCVSIAVQDCGAGMPPEIAARATEPFFTTKGPEAGTGLGLAMVEDFARRAGGQLLIKSAPGAGTTVTIILPRARAELAPAGSAALLTAAELAQTGAVILLADDDEPFRSITAMYLRDIGYSVIEAGSAEAAYTLAHSVERLDLLLTDLVLPGASGQSLAARLRAERPELRFLFVTGQAAPSLSGQDRVLRKPFRQAELASVVAQLLAPALAGD